MIHLKKSRCGYADYICTGIPIVPVLQEPICDNTAYDKSPQSDRKKDNNFLNLPQKFKGIVQTTTVLDLKQIVFERCVEEYNPLLEDGLLDVFKSLAENSEGYLHAQLQSLDCFTSNAQQPIGILLPSPELSAFQNIPLLVVPTVALPAAIQDPSAYFRSITSGCRGLVIAAKAVGSNRLDFSVSAGGIYLQNNQNQVPQQLQVKALKKTRIQGKDNVASVDVYVVAQYDFPTGKWKAVIDYTTKEHKKEDETPTKWIKRKHLGTIKYSSAGRTVDVIQSQCGPVDMRDWLSQQKFPSKSENGSLYLLTVGYVGNTAKKGWTPVKDAG